MPTSPPANIILNKTDNTPPDEDDFLTFSCLGAASLTAGGIDLVVT